MAVCVDTGSSQFRALQERSGLSEPLLEVLVSQYQSEHENMWPHLDELPIKWENSEKALQKFLGLDQSSIISQEDLLKKTNTASIEEAIVSLNDTYRNLDIDYTPINDKVKIITGSRPSKFRVVHTEAVDMSYLSSSVYINQALNEVERKLGIKTINTTSAELIKSGLLNIIPEASTAAAFIYNGDIYVNEDIAGTDSKVHELLHVLMGAMKFKNPELYANIVSIVENLENYNDLAVQYSNRTRMDINEEIFVTEYAKMIAASANSSTPVSISLLQQLDEGLLYNLNYEMTRVLDTMLKGDNSTAVIPASELIKKTFKELGEIVNSHGMENTIQSYLDTSLMHRILANKKSDLMKEGKLKEECK